MAQGVTEFIDLTTADFYLSEVWSGDCTVARDEKLVFASAVDRKFEPQLRRGQKIWIGNITHLTATTKSVNTAVSYETVTETGNSITVDTFKYAAFAIEDVIVPQISVNLADKYVRELGYALAEAEDAALAALIDDGTITQTVGTLATSIGYDNILRADQYLNDAKAPQDERVIIISPAEKANFYKQEQFINADYSKLSAGLLGSILGYPVLVTTNVDGSNAAGHDNVMMHKECIAHINQISPVVRSWWDGDYLAAKFVAVTSYGNAIIRADHGVWLKGA